VRAITPALCESDLPHVNGNREPDSLAAALLARRVEDGRTAVRPVCAPHHDEALQGSESAHQIRAAVFLKVRFVLTLAGFQNSVLATT
jgi:hypothetical protein